ncbi:MAG: hypothetical protein DRQ97_06840 [Gammaproteobacteria bacterium]|nr:MAG: hypothetical protein DRQ97_06840 [Gammaproteobacteria bacterium]
MLNADNGFNDANRSVVDQFGDWLNLSMNFTDDNDLFAWNITINASNGTVMYSDQNSSLNGTSELMVRDLNVSSWLAGWFDVSVWVSDSHTAKEIKPYVVTVKKDKKGMEFKTKEGNLITLETEEDATLSAKKKKDRYEWDVDFLDGKSSSRTFHLWSDRPIVYREDSPYKAHFVVMNGQQGNWVDFEGVAEVPTIKKLSDYHYTINFKKLKTAKFKSIGGLNTYTRTWSWYRGTDVYDAERATEGDSFDIWFNLTYDPSFTIDASLLWNGTAQNVTQQNGSNWRYFSATFTNQSLGTYWYYWTINVTQDDGNVSQFTINETHAVEDWYIDACGGATVTTMRWRQYNENTPASALNGTAQVLIEYWPVSKNNSKIFNHTYGSANFFEVCLSPANLNFSADVYLQNTVAGAFTHRFYVQNGSFNNVTTNYTIFNFNNQTGLSDMKITTRLEDDYSYLENVLVYLQRQYIGEGVWRTVQMDRSGDYGLLFFNILEQNTDYRLIYYDVVNNLLHQTTSMKFVCGSGVCDLTQLLGDYEVTTTSDQVTAVVSFDNATRVITVDWSGPPAESHTVELAAIKETVTGPLTLCSGIQVGASGTFSCNASGVSGQVFVTADVDGTDSAAAEWVDTRTTQLGDNLSRAESSLWSFGIGSTIVMIGVFSPVGALIALVIGLIIIFFLGILTPLSMTALILAAVVGIAISLKVKT